MNLNMMFSQNEMILLIRPYGFVVAFVFFSAIFIIATIIDFVAS